MLHFFTVLRGLFHARKTDIDLSILRLCGIVNFMIVVLYLTFTFADQMP